MYLSGICVNDFVNRSMTEMYLNKAFRMHKQVCEAFERLQSI